MHHSQNPSAAGHCHKPGLLGTPGTVAAQGEVRSRWGGLAVPGLHRRESGCAQGSRSPDGKASLPCESEVLHDGRQEPQARCPWDGIAEPPLSSSAGARRPFAWLTAGSLQTRRAQWHRGTGRTPPPCGTASGTLVSFVPFGLGLLPPVCEEALLVVTFTLELAVGGQVLRLWPLAAVHLHLQHGTGGRRQRGSAAPATAPSPGLVRGSDPPPQGRALAQGTHSTHPHQPAPPKQLLHPMPGLTPTSSSACRYCLANSSIFFWAAVRLW